MDEQLHRIAEQVLRLVERKADLQAEVYLLASEEMTVEVAHQKVENLKIAGERGLGLRVIANGRMGYAYSSDLSSPALLSIVESAINNAQETEPDPRWGLPVSGGAYPRLDIYDPEIFRTPLQQKIQLAQAIEEAARGYDRRIVLTEKAAYQEARYSVLIQNSLGLAGEYQGSYCGGYAVVVGREKEDSQTGFGMQYKLRYKDIDPKKIGQEAGNRAVRMLGAKTIPSARMPVILEPYIATNFLGVMQLAFSGEAVLKGKSFYAGQEGKKVASSLVTVIDDGTMTGRIGSSPFDGEGIPTEKTVLIQDGYLEGFLHNTYTAAKTHGRSTGNSIRSSYKSTPEVGVTNFYLQAGQRTPREMIGELQKGFYITDILGMHTANPVSGDFSLGAAGLLIENGELTVPVKGVAIAGNLREMLLDIDAVGSDLTFYISKGAPTMRIQNLSVSGK